VAHSARRSVLEQEITWTVDGVALIRTEKGIAKSYALTDVRAIRIAYDPTRVDQARHWCDVTFNSGFVQRIVSTHYCGFADFEDRGKSYSALVRALVAAVANINPACTFEAGKKKSVYIAEIAFMAVALMFLVWVLLLTAGMGVSEIVGIKLVLLAAMLPTLRSYLRKNWPRRFHADSIPDNALPSGR